MLCDQLRLECMMMMMMMMMMMYINFEWMDVMDDVMQ